MSYNWTTGEVITADKLNATGGGTSYDLVLTETFVENQDPAMTGTGLSFEEIMQKIDNGDDVSVKYIQHNTQYGAHYSCDSITCSHEHNPYSNADTLKVYGTDNGTKLGELINYVDGENITLTICGYTYYTFAYNSETQTYTFTFTGYVD